MKGNRIFIIRVVVATLLISIISFGGTILYASEPSLNASVTPEKGTVGQPMTYILTISGIDPGTLKITLPEKKIVYPDKIIDEKKDKKNSDQSAKSSEEFVPLYIINSAARDDSEVNGIKQISIKIILSYYRPGIHKLPEIKISGSDGVVIGYNIPSVTIEEINKEGKLEEVEPPVSLGGNYTRIIWIVAGLLFVAAAAFLLYRYLKQRRKTPEIEKPSLPPIEIFLHEVESLKLRELIIDGKINEYVFDISIIFRRYLSAMLNFDAAEMTTDEIELKIKKYMPQNLYSIFGDEIIRNMRLWDYSKFAGFAPSKELLIDNLGAAVSVAKKISESSVSSAASGKEGGENGTPRV